MNYHANSADFTRSNIPLATVNSDGAFGEISGNQKNSLSGKSMESVSSYESLYKFINSNVDAVIVMNENLEIMIFNPAAERLFGYNESEVVGKKLTPLLSFQVHDEIINGEKEGCIEWIKNAIGQTQILSAAKKDGSGITIELALSDISTGDSISYAAIMRDITVSEELKKKLEEKTAQLELTNIKLEEANKLKSEFLANASHELRTPLNSIIGFLRLIVDGLCQSEDEEKEFINNALESSKHLLRLINDILDISKIEAGKMTLDLEEIDPEKILNDLYILTYVQAQQKGLKLEINIPESNKIHIRADYAKLKQVLLNLIGNAIKFTHTGKIVVDYVPMPDKGFVKFFVKDTGIGVSEEKIKKLFNKFVQGDGSMTRKYGGTGLGLAITKSLVELMGGIIQMQSEGEGKGTVVCFTVPIFSGMPNEEKQAILVSNNQQGEKPLILVVEDDPVIRSIIEDILRQQGLSTISAETADDAVAAARKYHPNVVTLDFGLIAREHAVLKNGWDIVKVLSQDNSTKDIKLIIISGYDDPIKTRIKEEGLDIYPEFIEKPFDAKILIEKIYSLLNSFSTNK